MSQEAATAQADARSAEWIASPNFNARHGEHQDADVVVLHSTCMNTNDIQECIQWFETPKSRVSSHYIVGKDGRVVQMVSEANRAWHAGECDWQGRRDINSCSIGIEMVHRDQDPNDTWPEAQLEAMAVLLADIRSRHAVPDNHIILHSECAIPPGRKTDPRNFPREFVLRIAEAVALASEQRDSAPKSP